jgi:hypothetical protein
MPEQQTIVKAELQEVTLRNDGQEGTPGSKRVTVQFNPQTLKVNYSSQNAGAEKNAAVQHLGNGTTKLSLELVFDATVPGPDGTAVDDVRTLTKEIGFFITASDKKTKGVFIPPGVRFTWGSFLFEGVVDSMDETLEFFSAEGKPLRATVSLALSRQEIVFRPGKGAAQGAEKNPAGTVPQAIARAGESLQQMAGRAGKGADWKAIASANGIENPRQISPGTLIDLQAKAGASASGSATISATAGGSVSAGGSINAGGSGNATVNVRTR